MIYKTAQFKIKKSKVKESLMAIKKFVENDGLTFTHFMVFKDKKAEEFHRDTNHVNEFTKILYPNCSKKPEFKELNLVSSNKH